MSDLSNQLFQEHNKWLHLPEKKPKKKIFQVQSMILEHSHKRVQILNRNL